MPSWHRSLFPTGMGKSSICITATWFSAYLQVYLQKTLQPPLLTNVQLPEKKLSHISRKLQPKVKYSLIGGLLMLIYHTGLTAGHCNNLYAIKKHSPLLMSPQVLRSSGESCSKPIIYLSHFYCALLLKCSGLLTYMNLLFYLQNSPVTESQVNPTS